MAEPNQADNGLSMAKPPEGVRPQLTGWTGIAPTGIKGLHHAAMRCRNSEETREFYEDFLGLKMVEAMHIKMGDGPGAEHVLHTFFQLDDGSAIAFFDAPKRPFEWKEQSDLDLHMAFEVDSHERMMEYYNKAKARNIEVRGPSDHGFVKSIYIRDPNGYVFELTNVVNKVENHYTRKDAPDPKKILAGFMSEAHGIGDAKAVVAEDTWQKRAADAAAEKQSKL